MSPAMPGSEKVQPAPRKARGFRGQDTVERHGGLGVVMEKIVQWEQEDPASNGRDMIDDFRLRGSRTWRRMGGHLSDGGWLTRVAHQVAHAFDHPNAYLPEGEVLAVVVQVVPGNPHWKRVGTDSPSPLRQSVVRHRRRASPPRTARRGAAQEGEEVEGATPVFWPLVRHERVERWPGLWPPFRPSFSGRSLHIDPGGKAVEPLWKDVTSTLRMRCAPGSQRPVSQLRPPARRSFCFAATCLWVLYLQKLLCGHWPLCPGRP